MVSLLLTLLPLRISEKLFMVVCGVFWVITSQYNHGELILILLKMILRKWLLGPGFQVSLSIFINQIFFKSLEAPLESLFLLMEIHALFKEGDLPILLFPSTSYNPWFLRSRLMIVCNLWNMKTCHIFALTVGDMVILLIVVLWSRAIRRLPRMFNF